MSLLNCSGEPMPASAVSSPVHTHLLKTEFGQHLFVVDGSRLFDLDSESFARLSNALSDADIAAVLEDLGLGGSVRIGDEAPQHMPNRALSLAVAQDCNLGCTYCYAREGNFGLAPKHMSSETALAAVDLLIAETEPSERINLAFLGGEPLMNRSVLQAATEYARDRTSMRGQAITFSITTNGTLVTLEDIAFFERFGFAVTVSIDGSRSHDRQRPYKGGRGSFNAILQRIEPMLASQKAMQVSARVTVTPLDIELRPILDELLALGFYTVGFSPMLSSPSGMGEMDGESLARMLQAMIGCGSEFERRVLQGKRYSFANIITALREIHRGTHRPYPCGAGGGYLGVSADGGLAACHRFVGDPERSFGTLGLGVDRVIQRSWLSIRHVHRQEPCRSCWARYLCGGSCHHEAKTRGRAACTYIRGWLHYCLEAYVRLSTLQPTFFAEEPL